MIHCVDWLQKSIQEKYDEYGDPYFSYTNVEDLRQIFNTMKVDKEVEIKEVQDEIQPSINIFSNEKFYLRNKPNSQEFLLLKQYIFFYGGKVSHELSTDIDYIIDMGLNKKQMNVVKVFLKKNTYSKVISRERVIERIEDYYEMEETD